MRYYNAEPKSRNWIIGRSKSNDQNLTLNLEVENRSESAALQSRGGATQAQTVFLFHRGRTKNGFSKLQELGKNVFLQLHEEEEGPLLLLQMLTIEGDTTEPAKETIGFRGPKTHFGEFKMGNCGDDPDRIWTQKPCNLIKFKG